jgi:hypothetical protein
LIKARIASSAARSAKVTGRGIALRSAASPDAEMRQDRRPAASARR